MKSLSLTVPHVIAMIGLPGTGKTYFAEAFSESLKVPLVDEEYFRRLAHTPDAGTEMAADVLHQIMKTRQVILFEGHLDTQEERESLTNFCKKEGYEVLFVWVQTEPETAKKRALKMISSGEYKARMQAFMPPTKKERHAVISGKHTQATQARTVLKRLVEASARPAAPVAPPARPTTPTRNRAG